MRALLTSAASAGRALATVLGGRALACNSSPQCCNGACRQVFKVYPCQPYAGDSGECPDPGPLWVCADALYSDGQRVNTISARRLTYSGLCYAPGGGVGQPEDLTDTNLLPPGTNILNTGDFGFTDAGCASPECGSARTFIRANLCSGQSTVGSTVTQVWVCAGEVALKGCGVISRGSSDTEASLCWLVSPSSDAVDEDEIGTTPDIVKVFDDYDPDPRGCCFCVAGCITTTGFKRACVGSTPSTDSIECCCDSQNFRVRVTGYNTTNQFFDSPPSSASATLLRPGVLSYIGGVQQPDTITTLIEQNDGGGPFTVDIGYPLLFCSDFVLPVNPPAGTTSGMGQQCSIDLRDANGIGDVVTVGYTHSCTQQSINAVVEYYQPFGGDPNPRVRNRSTYFYSIEREQITTARCSGECPPAGGSPSLQAFNRLLGLSTQQLSDILRRA